MESNSKYAKPIIPTMTLQVLTSLYSVYARCTQTASSFSVLEIGFPPSRHCLRLLFRLP